MKKILNFILTFVLVLLTVGALVIYAPKLIGIHPMIVMSGSMEPEIPAGALLYVRKAGADSVRKGKPVTFYLDGKTLVTHRVVSIDRKKKTIITKGDANNVEDPQPISFSKVYGIPVFHIPKAGYLANYLNRFSGKMIYMVLVVVDIMFMYLLDWIKPAGGGRKNES